MLVRVTLPVLTLFFVIGIVLSAARLHAESPVAASVQIDAVAIVGTTVTITGRNFGSGVPTVSVSDTNASVSRNSDTEIVVVVAQLEPGIYVLKVVRDANEGGTGETTLMVR